mmetsp:Transcript_14485/g.31780  ORF Transcript_14485/g.31780 Transcript_14485/m.31780 type:complete len:257 (-) Transcript_14485:375-1145(-)
MQRDHGKLVKLRHEGLAVRAPMHIELNDPHILLSALLDNSTEKGHVQIQDSALNLRIAEGFELWREVELLRPEALPILGFGQVEWRRVPAEVPRGLRRLSSRHVRHLAARTKARVIAIGHSHHARPLVQGCNGQTALPGHRSLLRWSAMLGTKFDRGELQLFRRGQLLPLYLSEPRLSSGNVAGIDLVGPSSIESRSQLGSRSGASSQPRQLCGYLAALLLATLRHPLLFLALSKKRLGLLQVRAADLGLVRLRNC